MRVLVTEPDRDMRAAVVELLEELGVEVETATTRAAARAALRRGRGPDVLVLNRDDAWCVELAIELKHDPLRELPTVLLGRGDFMRASGSGWEVDRRALIAALVAGLHRPRTGRGEVHAGS